MNRVITNAEDIKVIQGLKNEEKETNINWYCDSKTAVLYTTDNKVVTKMKHLFERNPNTVKCTEYYSEHGVDSYRFEFPIKGLSFRNTDKQNSRKREMTDEQRKAASERMKKARINKLLGN